MLGTVPYFSSNAYYEPTEDAVLWEQCAEIAVDPTNVFRLSEEF